MTAPRPVSDLRVGLLSPIAWRTPPRHYGPWEQFVSLLSEGLVARGVDVTLFATGDSLTNAKLKSFVQTSYSEDATYDVKVAECMHISQCFEAAKDFDILHNSFDFLPLTYSALVDTPLVTTIHGFANDTNVPVYMKYNDRGAYVSISDADRHPQLTYAATIRHGIETSKFATSDKPDDYLLFFGRMHHDKGAVEAIKVAQRTGRRLVMAGIIQDNDYYCELVEPHIDGEQITFIGPINAAQRPALLANAAVLLHMINFDEPFGFSVAEAAASGTPTIAMERGSMAELIRDGETGFLVHSLDEAVEAVGKIDAVDRQLIRDHAVNAFGVDRMVDEYLALYEKVLAR